MSHGPIIIQNVSLSFSDKVCFEHFSATIHAGDRILIIGNNGTGKSTLLKMLQGVIDPNEGAISGQKNVTFGYVSQTIADHDTLSGGQRFNKALSDVIGMQPDILCLDEPTNHLDLKNKRSLIRMLKTFYDTLIIISHDSEVMALDYDQIWHIEHGKVNVFKGDYSAFLHEHQIRHNELVERREQLGKEKRAVAKKEQQESQRAASSKSANRNENDRTIIGSMKERSSSAAGKFGKRLAKVEERIKLELEGTFVHKKIEPKFSLDVRRLSSSKSVVSVIDGSCGYESPCLVDINVEIKPTDHIGIIGDNGSGKSTFLKAILGSGVVYKEGQWLVPAKKDIGYLDQHYNNLDFDMTVKQIIENAAPEKNDHEIRKLLNDFLFSKPSDVTKKVSDLSGGEKARLSLAQIAAAGYYFLLLDEITNNIDQETRGHIIDVLRDYPGAMIIVTHDVEFLKELNVETVYEVADKTLQLTAFENL